jgi:hypothetical protein
MHNSDELTANRGRARALAFDGVIAAQRQHL